LNLPQGNHVALPLFFAEELQGDTHERTAILAIRDKTSRRRGRPR
jgi:hypothetical protein